MYDRVVISGRLDPHTYISKGEEKHTTIVEQSRSETVVKTGIKNLLILKTTDSGFENYIKDRYTTLKETADRILATNCDIAWTYNSGELDFSNLYLNIRKHLLETFAHHKSLSVQQTLYAMGEEVLASHAEVEEISLVMPNKHHILFNLEQFGMTNDNEIFVATDEPFGYITGTISRNSR